MKDIHIAGGPALTVQEAAERIGLSVHTLRYYERMGLIAHIARDEGSGHRRYSQDDLAGIRFLMRLRATGMSIQEMQRYVALYREGDRTLPERNRMMQEHRDRVRNRIAEMQAHLDVIERKIETGLCLWRERKESIK